MKLLVTGAGGFLGTALVERLAAHGYTGIRCNLRRTTRISKPDAIAERFPQFNLEYCIGNLKSREFACRAADAVQLIFHLAAGLKGDAADLFFDSVVASQNLLNAVADRKPMRIVLVSSYGVAPLGRNARVNEQTPLESHPEWRDDYSHSKLRQEQLFWEYQGRYGFELVVLRPGVIYGPGGGHFSARLGIPMANSQLFLGGRNLLPLTYVENCAEALVVAGAHERAAGQVYNVHDDDLPTCRQYLRAYKKSVRKIPSIPLPYSATRLLSRALVTYNRFSKGQLPAVLTPYKVAGLWAGNDLTIRNSIRWAGSNRCRPRKRSEGLSPPSAPKSTPNRKRALEHVTRAHTITPPWALLSRSSTSS